MRLIFFISLLAISVAGCAKFETNRNDSPESRFLAGLSDPPLNQPVSFEQQISEIPKAAVSVRNPNATLILKNNEPVTGKFEMTGTISLGKESFKLEDKAIPNIDILFRVPPGMQLPEKTTFSGTLSGYENSGPGGADRLIVVNADSRLVFLEIWKRERTPITIWLPDGSALSQEPMAKSQGDQESQYAGAEVTYTMPDENYFTVPVGEVITLEAEGQTLQIFVETSFRFIAQEKDLGQYPSEYVLHAWIITASSPGER